MKLKKGLFYLIAGGILLEEAYFRIPDIFNYLNKSQENAEAIKKECAEKVENFLGYKFKEMPEIRIGRNEYRKLELTIMFEEKSIEETKNYINELFNINYSFTAGQYYDGKIYIPYVNDNLEFLLIHELIHHYFYEKDFNEPEDDEELKCFKSVKEGLGDYAAIKILNDKIAIAKARELIKDWEGTRKINRSYDKYVLGYHFVSNLFSKIHFNKLGKVIENPPKNYDELLDVELYLKNRKFLAV